MRRETRRIVNSGLFDDDDNCWGRCRLKKQEGERENLIHHKANNQYYNQNELMWQAARAEIPI